MTRIKNGHEKSVKGDVAKNFWSNPKYLQMCFHWVSFIFSTYLCVVTPKGEVVGIKNMET